MTKHWSRTEVESLTKYFIEGMNDKEISVILNRTPSGVFGKRQRIGLNWFKQDGSKREIYICPVCGKSFEKYISQTVDRDKIHCSSACAFESLRTRETGNCIICDTEFLKHTSLQKSCSLKCMGKHRSNEIIGSNSVLYIDGRSKEKPSYRGPLWQQTRKNIIKKYNNQCQHCGIKVNGKKAHVHHIKEYHISKDNSEENLILLCLSCHSKVHSKKRKKTK